MDRFIQQALLQILTPIFEGIFCDESYGFRPGKSAHQAIEKSKSYVEKGNEYVVDLDLQTFFDTVDHGIMMSRVSRYVKDERIIKLINRYLQSGIMVDGVRHHVKEGTPQGGPLSPLLANILLHEFDELLKMRGHKFCRYADDCNIYVKSQRA